MAGDGSAGRSTGGRFSGSGRREGVQMRGIVAYERGRVADERWSAGWRFSRYGRREGELQTREGERDKRGRVAYRLGLELSKVGEMRKKSGREIFSSTWATRGSHMLQLILP